MENKVTVIYSDDEWNPTTAKEATRAEIREYDEAGKCVRATYGRFIEFDYRDLFDFDDDMESPEEEDDEENDE